MTATATLPKSRRGSDLGEGPLASWAFRAGVALALVPIVVAVVRALSSSWYLASDDAVLTLRAFDVFSLHPPLLGSWSSGSGWAGINFNNPGPLQFWLLAIPVRILGPTVGVVVGQGTLNALAVGAVAWLARRRGGSWFALATMVGVLGLEWAMGSVLLFDVWQPHAAVLPCAVLLFAVWAIAAGDVAGLPFVVVAGSLLAQMHLSYIIVAPGLAVGGLALLAAWVRGAAGEERQGRARRTARWFAWSIAGGVVLWLPTIIQQFTVHPGNLTELARASGASGGPPATGVSGAVHTVGSVVALPPLWFRPGWSRPTFETVRLGEFLPFTYPLVVAVVSFVVVCALLIAAGVRAHTQRDRSGAVGALVALGALALAVVSTSQARSGFHSIESYVRGLWPIAMFVWLYLGLQLWLLVASRRPDRSRSVRWAGLLLVPCLLLAALGCIHAEYGSGSPVWAWAPSRAVVDQGVPRLLDRGPILVHEHLDLGAYAVEPSLMLALARHRVPFYTDDVPMSHQIGANHLLRHQHAATTVWMASGDGALTTPDGAERLASRRGLSRAEESEMRALRGRLRGWVAVHGIPLSTSGRRLLAKPWMQGTRELVVAARTHPEAALGTQFLDVLLRDHMLGLPLDSSVMPDIIRLRDLAM
ncbi:MAG: hypothetical protein ABI276_01405, partial [Acidimicrobiales bacterium]